MSKLIKHKWVLTPNGMEKRCSACQALSIRIYGRHIWKWSATQACSGLRRVKRFDQSIEDLRRLRVIK